jgi:hypothetical protein
VVLNRVLAAALVSFALTPAGAEARGAVSCGGAAMMGGAQLACSHVTPEAPAQFCTFSWDLMTTENGQQIVEGSFMLPPGASNVTVYQGSGFASALSNPIVLCQGRKGSG